MLAAAPASAHVEVTAEGARAGTGPITLSFSAESESSTSGIASIKAHVPYRAPFPGRHSRRGPAGWVLTPTTDGYEISGPAIEPGADAVYPVTVPQLPADATGLVFPPLQRGTPTAARPARPALLGEATAITSAVQAGHCPHLSPGAERHVRCSGMTTGSLLAGLLVTRLRPSHVPARAASP